MNTMPHTHHARRRQQQRSISAGVIALAMRWGVERHLGGGVTELWVTRQAAKDAAAAQERIDSAVGVVLVIGADGALITTFWR